jgi:hypothetical protein
MHYAATNVRKSKLQLERKTMSTTPKTKLKKIKALLGLDKMPDGNVTPLLDGSLKGLTAHADIFSQPPVDLKTYGTGIASYEGAIPAALDGSKTAVAQKNKLRNAAVKMYTQNAHYVEANCNEDLATFLLSGFTPANTTKTPPQPLAQPTIATVVQGAVTGQLKVKIAPVKKALSYVLRHAAAPPEETPAVAGTPPAAGTPLAAGTPVTTGTPPAWIEQTITSTKPVLINKLAPGTVYMFQVRALGRLGYTDWSDSVSRMVT